MSGYLDKKACDADNADDAGDADDADDAGEASKAGETGEKEKQLNTLLGLFKLFKKRIPITILNNNEVLSQFLNHKKITVIRSSGEIDYGWEITPTCYPYFVIKPNLNNSWSVEVEKGDLSKVIKVIDLKMSLKESDHYIVDELIAQFNATM